MSTAIEGDDLNKKAVVRSIFGLHPMDFQSQQVLMFIHAAKTEKVKGFFRRVGTVASPEETDKLIEKRTEDTDNQQID